MSYPMFIPQRIAVHHSASRRSTSFNDVQRWHRERGWAEIGYNHVILGSGAHRPGRTVPQRASAVARNNTGTLSILLMGDNTKPSQRWVQDQVESLIDYVEALQLVWPHLEGEVYGHRDLAKPGHPTLCPGLDLRKLARAHNWNVDAYWHNEGD